MADQREDEVSAEWLEQVGLGKGRLITDLGQGLVAYREMLARKEFSPAPAWVERMAETWRAVAEVEGLEQLGDGLLPEEATQLFGVLEDSLILCESRDEVFRTARLELGELAHRSYLAGRDGTFGEEWFDEMEVAVPELPKRSRGYFFGQGRRKRREVGKLVVDRIEQTSAEAISLYKELDPDGRELDPQGRSSAINQIEMLAATDRVADVERFTFSEVDWRRLRPLLAVLRSIRRSLTLACSEDAERRKLAMPVPEFQGRVFIYREMIDGATYAEGYERFMQAVEEQSGPAGG